MSKEKIEEMAKDIFESGVAIDGIDRAFAAVHGADMTDSHFMRIAQHLYNAGYRKQSDGDGLLLTFDGATGYFPKEFIIEAIKTHMKQSVGEWKLGKSGCMYFCSSCGYSAFPREEEEWNFCPRCGTKMKGGAE